MKNVDEKKTEVCRSQTLTTEQLVEHIKAVGQAIVDDAERISIDAKNIRSISIKAEIAPLEQVTTIEYTYNRIADPRVK